MSSDQENILSWAREVLEIESRVLSEVQKTLGENFIQAVTMVDAVTRRGQGRIIVSGVGKSGLVARKWVATFNGTGTPAFFVNPVEAAHGDLGAIRQDDLLILLSLSGETEELGHLVNFARISDLPLIAVTAVAQSTLARAASVTLNVCVSREACPLNLAPTASTTAMMALGDALALTAMRLRGFSAEDFARLHPGGSLGKRLFLKVSDLMHQGAAIPRVANDATMEAVILEMTEKKLGAALVFDQEHLCGIVTDGDLRRFLHKKKSIHHTLVTEALSPSPKTVSAQDLAVEAYLAMTSSQITHLAVVDDAGVVCGFLHLHDLLKARIVV